MERRRGTRSGYPPSQNILIIFIFFSYSIVKYSMRILLMEDDSKLPASIAKLLRAESLVVDIAGDDRTHALGYYYIEECSNLTVTM
jgi:hypothetical protein